MWTKRDNPHHQLLSGSDSKAHLIAMWWAIWKAINECGVKKKVLNPMWALSLANKIVRVSKLFPSGPFAINKAHSVWDGRWDLEHSAILFVDAFFLCAIG